MKKYILLLSAMIFSGITLISCSTSTTTDKIYSASLAGNGKSTKLADNDLRFLVKAYATGLFKMGLATEAQIRSTSAESRQLANAVISFHTNLNSQIEEIAKEHAFTLPADLTDDQKKLWKQLVKEKGWAFDKKFAEMMETFSTDEAMLFELAVKNSSDKSVTVLAQKAQPEIDLHETLRVTLKEKIGEKSMIALAKEDTKEKTKNKTKNKSKANLSKT